MRAVAYVAWFVAPWPALRLGGGRIGTYLFILLALMALAIASQRGSFGLNRTSRVMVQITFVMIVGMAVGELHGGGSTANFVRLGLYFIAAVAPVIAINVLDDRDRTVRHLGLSFLFGTLVSLALASSQATLPLLRSGLGFTGHKNQLAATLVISLPLVALVKVRSLQLTRVLRLAIAAVILVGLNDAVSRSGLLAVAVMVVLVALLVKPRRRLWVRTTVGGAVALAIAALVSGNLGSLIADTTSSGSLARAAGEVSTSRSDQIRLRLLSTGLDALDFRTAIFGQGFALDRQPHNVFLGMWVAGGLLAGLGLVAILLLAFRSFSREALDLHRRDVYLLVFSLSVVGYCVVAFFNVLFWVPYAWAIIALFAASEDRRSNVEHDVKSPAQRPIAPTSSAIP